MDTIPPSSSYSAAAAASHVRLMMRFLRGRWMAVAVSFYMLLVSGGTYIFGIYSGDIKSALHYNQETIDSISFFKDLGGNVGILAGLMNEVSPPSMVLSVGAALNLFGYLMIWLSVTHRVAVPSAGAISFYMYAAANSQTFANTAVLVACVKNFPLSRGIVLGLTKGCIGLSGAVFVQIYHAIYGQDTTDMILFLAWLPSLIILIFMFFIRRTEPVLDQNNDRHFFFLLYLALTLAGFLTVAIIMENTLSLPSHAYKAFGTVAVLLVAANVLVAVRAECERRSSTEKDRNQETSERQPSPSSALLSQDEASKARETARNSVRDGGVDKGEGQTQFCTAPTDEEKADAGEQRTVVGDEKQQMQRISGSGPYETVEYSSDGKKKSDGVVVVSRSSSCFGRLMHSRGGCVGVLYWKARAYFRQWPERGEDHSIPQALLSLDMWILFIAVTCGVGGSLAAVDNMGQIGQSLGYAKVSISTCVSLISIWNFLGRVTAGFVSEHLLRRYGVSRALVLCVILGLSSVGHVLIAFPGPGTLYAASVLVGFCFGAMWPPLYAVISEIFGLKYFATLYNVVGTVSPLGSYLLNVKVAGHLYDRQTTSADGVCYGSHCFRLAFSIIAIASFAGCLVSLLLVVRTRKFYSQDIYARLLHATTPQQQQCSA